MNRDEVEERLGLSNQSGAYWSFIIASEATSCETEREEILELCRHLFESFDGFYTPNVIKHFTLIYNQEEETPFRNPRSDEADHETTPWADKIEEELRSSDGISFTHFIDSLSGHSSTLSRISAVHFRSGTTKMHLNEEEIPVGGYGLEDDPAGFDPLHIEIISDYDPTSPSLEELGIDRSILILVNSNSQIWFEDSIIGRKNRDSLEKFFESVVSNLDVVFIEYDRQDGPRRDLYLD